MGILEAKAKLARFKEAQKTSKKLKIPFYLEIQKPQNLAKLKRIERIQEETLRNIIAKYHRQLRGHEKDIFAQFFTEYLDGSVASIDEFLYGKVFKDRADFLRFCGLTKDEKIEFKQKHLKEEFKY